MTDKSVFLLSQNLQFTPNSKVRAYTFDEVIDVINNNLVTQLVILVVHVYRVNPKVLSGGVISQLYTLDLKTAEFAVKYEADIFPLSVVCGFSEFTQT